MPAAHAVSTASCSHAISKVPAPPCPHPCLPHRFLHSICNCTVLLKQRHWLGSARMLQTSLLQLVAVPPPVAPPSSLALCAHSPIHLAPTTVLSLALDAHGKAGRRAAIEGGSWRCCSCLDLALTVSVQVTLSGVQVTLSGVQVTLSGVQVTLSGAGGGEGRWGQHRHFPTPLPGGHAGTRGDGREAALQQMAIAPQGRVSGWARPLKPEGGSTGARAECGVNPLTLLLFSLSPPSHPTAPWLDHSGVPPSLNPPLPTSQQPQASWHCTALVGTVQVSRGKQTWGEGRGGGGRVEGQHGSKRAAHSLRGGTLWGCGLWVGCGGWNLRGGGTWCSSNRSGVQSLMDTVRADRPAALVGVSCSYVRGGI
ncbi:unnamed protein product [Closterium sp. NIES-65]|nr:unnamed protein product [Closterium sp. NIES-65]